MILKGSTFSIPVRRGVTPGGTGGKKEILDGGGNPGGVELIGKWNYKFQKIKGCNCKLLPVKHLVYT